MMIVQVGIRIFCYFSLMNPIVTQFLDQLNHPLRLRIEALRAIILAAQPELQEHIKWNGPNYTFQGADRITIRVNPPGALDLVLHMGAKMNLSAQALIKDDHGLLIWKSPDRAVVNLKDSQQFEAAKPVLMQLIRSWLSVPV